MVGILLASSGYDAIRAGHHASWLDWVAIVSGGLLLVVFVIEMRRARSAKEHDAHGVAWVDVFAAAVTLVEAAHLQHKGKVGLPFAYLLVAILLLTIGVMHSRLRRLRRLVVDEHGFDIRTAPWSRTRLAWSDVADVQRAGDVVMVETRAGQTRRIDLRGMDHGGEAIAALLRHADVALAPAADVPPVADTPPTAAHRSEPCEPRP